LIPTLGITADEPLFPAVEQQIDRIGIQCELSALSLG
jgi:hypothetical protein